MNIDVIFLLMNIYIIFLLMNIYVIFLLGQVRIYAESKPYLFEYVSSHIRNKYTKQHNTMQEVYSGGLLSHPNWAFTFCFNTNIKKVNPIIVFGY